MSDPMRWRDGDPSAPDGAEELLAAARPIRPMSAEVDARQRSRLAHIAAIPVGLFATLASSKAIAIVVTTVSLATTSAVVMTEYAWSDESNEEVAPRRRVTKRAAPERERPPEREGPRETTAAEPTPVVVEAPEALPTPPVASRRARRRSAPVAEKGLAREAALLEEARAALDDRPAETLRILRRYDRKFPRGSLGIERRVLEIEALYKSGRNPAARRAATRFLRRYGNTAYATRIRALLTSMTRADDKDRDTPKAR